MESVPKRICLEASQIACFADFQNPLHCVPYTVNLSDGTTELRYSLSASYLIYLQSLSLRSLDMINHISSSSIEETRSLKREREGEFAFLDKPFEDVCFDPKPSSSEDRDKTITNLFVATITANGFETRINTRHISRLHAMILFFGNIIPETKPLRFENERWDRILSSIEINGLINFRKFKPQKIIVDFLDDFDALVHAQANEGVGREHYHFPERKTRCRWWGQIEVPGFYPLKNKRITSTISEHIFTLPPPIVNHPKMQQYYLDTDHKSLSKAIANILTIFLHRLIGKEAYEYLASKGFKVGSLTISVLNPKAFDEFEDITVKYFQK